MQQDLFHLFGEGVGDDHNVIVFLLGANVGNIYQTDAYLTRPGLHMSVLVVRFLYISEFVSTISC